MNRAGDYAYRLRWLVGSRERAAGTGQDVLTHSAAGSGAVKMTGLPEVIVLVPHRDRYEKRKTLPSNWNGEHRWYWLPEQAEPPCTLSFRAVLAEAIPDADVVSFGVLDEGFSDPGPHLHSRGEYSIEAILRKRP